MSNGLEFRGHGDPLRVLGDDDGFACVLVADHRKAIFGSNQQGVETVEGIGQVAHGGVEVVTFLLHPPRHETGGDFGVVLRVEYKAFVHQLTTDRVVVGEGTVVHDG